MKLWISVRMLHTDMILILTLTVRFQIEKSIEQHPPWRDSHHFGMKYNSTPPPSLLSDSCFLHHGACVYTNLRHCYWEATGLLLLALSARKTWADDRSKLTQNFQKIKQLLIVITIFRITMENAFKWVQTCLVSVH